MSTRAGIGFRHKGQDWLMYHHSDGGMPWLGMEILRFCRQQEPALMRTRVDQFIKLDENTEAPTQAQILEVAPILALSQEKVVELLLKAKTVKEGGQPDWDEVLDMPSDELEYFMAGLNYWPDYEGFILSRSCEWGYIINLDTEKLEIYTSHYSAPDHVYKGKPKIKPTGRYSEAIDDEEGGGKTRGGTLLDEIPLKDVRDVPEFALLSFAARIDRQH